MTEPRTEHEDREGMDAHGHRRQEPGSPGFASRRRFMRQAFAAAGVAAFGTMVGVSRAGASSNVSLADATTTPSATASAAPSGGPGGGGGGAPGVKDAFVGVTTDGTVIEDLYSIHRTGVSTGQSVAAAKAWLASLTATQREAVTFPVQVSDYTQDQWRLWTNIDSDRDAGLSLQDMTKAQRAKAQSVLKAGMSARGIKNADKVRHLNLYGGQLVDETDQFNDELYWLTIMGTPSTREPWGWQFEGHHLVINYFVLGDQVVMTPTFMGSEPRVADYGIDSKYEGTKSFEDELAAGYDLLRSLSADQQSVAVTTSATSDRDLTAGAYSDNAVMAYEGIAGSELNPAQLAKLWRIVELFVGNVDEGHARVKMAEVKKHKDDTHFSWHGATTDDTPMYYRIHSPVVLIELDSQDLGPIGKAAGWAAGMTQRHIHAIIRTPNGNDYGKDLLSLHLALDH
ncbi:MULTISPECIES: DUF3500 domain-containing protein [unclassified Streptomyces]|uniref:DUF3500 domain-containing protein n=1 Tax=unclassified Streptomyces TaxID=2593676 RepID=UPI002E176C0B